MNRAEIKQMAKDQIKGKIGILFAISLIGFIVAFGGVLLLSMIPVVGGIALALCVTAPLTLGGMIVYLKVASYQEVQVKDLFEGYNDMWGAFKVQFFMGLFTFLWALLFYIPGIIKAISYSMSMYVLAENKGMPALEAIERSKMMMRGHKMEYFVLGLSFIGWMFVVTITFGIAGIWVYPYMSTTFANFYNKIKPQNGGAQSQYNDYSMYY